MSDSKITFIIPTIGRSTLSRSIKSILSQDDPNWKAIVLFDGVKKNIHINDNRFSMLEIDKMGEGNRAGDIRNFGISKANTEWVAFLDDDDTISPKYIKRFNEEIEFYKDVECVIFRMWNGVLTLPSIHHNTFYIHRVGISFAMKKSLQERFIASSTEDFDILNKMRNNKRKMIISPYINYFVRTSPNELINNNKYPRIFINF